jgi:predicted ATPase
LHSAIAISRIATENFLSLQKIEFALGPLTVLVGPNGVGKSNILRLFQFLGDVARRDLVPAISALGGFEQLAFRHPDRKDRPVRLHLIGKITPYASDRALDEYKLSFWSRSYRTANSTETKRLI